MLKLAVVSLICVWALPLSATPPPLLPPKGMDLFPPMTRSSIVTTNCGQSSATIEWSHDGQSIKINRLKHNDSEASEADLAPVEQKLLAFDGDMFVRLECTVYGLAATFIEERSAGTQRTQRFRINYIDGRVIFVGRDKFNVK